MAHIPRQQFSKSVQQSLAHIPRQILARFSRRPYSSFLARFPRGRTAISAQISRQQRGCFIWHEFIGRLYSKWLSSCTEIEADSVQQVSDVFWHKFRGPYSSIYCCFGTDFEVAVPLHLLQIFGHEKRENPYSIYCCSCFAVCTFSEAVVKHGKRDKL